MNKSIIPLALFLFLILNSCSNDLPPEGDKKQLSTSIGMVIYSNDVETIWNALRLANYSKTQGDTVHIFLLGKGVEVDNLVKENKDLKDQVDSFLEKGGTILGCGTCLQSRNNNEPEVCKFSSLKDLYQLIRENKIVLTF
jgi:uncharacterized protein involved in oxidation of intracellular sulfur